MTITETITRAVESMPTGGVSLALGVDLQQDDLYHLFEGLWGKDLEQVKRTVIERLRQRKGDQSHAIESVGLVTAAKRR